MRIAASRPEYKPTWLDAHVLDRLWKLSGSPYVASWTGLPRFPDWFDYENGQPVAFKTADLYLELVNGVRGIKFLDGRHRTRWLMTRFDLVPVGLEERHYEEAVRLGLARRRVEIGERFDTY